MPAIADLLADLEAAVRAVEPRALEGLRPGLHDAEIDARMANCGFALPDDLRALYRWHDADDFGSAFLDGFWHFMPLRPNDQDSRWMRREVREFFEAEEKAVPFDADKTDFVYLFGDGGGSELVGLCFANQHETCEIRQREKGGLEWILKFRGVEPMVQTALAWWSSGVFSSSEHRYGWELERDSEKRRAIARRLNPDCSYWFG